MPGTSSPAIRVLALTAALLMAFIGWCPVASASPSSDSTRSAMIYDYAADSRTRTETRRTVKLDPPSVRQPALVRRTGLSNGETLAYDAPHLVRVSRFVVATETGSEGVDLTKGGRDKIDTLEGDKDKTVADVIRERGGGGAQVRDVGHWGERTLGEAANAAAAGDKAAEKAVKGAKQAGTKGQRKYGK